MLGKPLLALTASAFLLGVAQAEYKLHILHINDLHSRIESVSKYDGTCSAESETEGKCFGGVARLYPALMKLRDDLVAKGENVLLLDAGDQFQGSLMYTTYKGKVEAEFMNMAGFDAMAVGNHEFDDGPEGLAGFLADVDVPVISGNIDVSGSELLAGKIKDHLVLERGGEKIGLVSALATDTVETSSPGAQVLFADEVASLQDDVNRLSAQGVNKIIALTHVGLPMDKTIAAQVSGLDAVIGGHSHTLLSNTSDQAAGGYPTMIGEVPVVQAYAYSKYFGHLTLVFDDAGTVKSATGDTILVDASYPIDESMAGRIAKLAGPIEELKARVVGRSSALIEGDRSVCRTQECEMGNLVADAMLDRVKAQGVTIALHNGGGLRTSIDTGEITMGEVLTVLPFQNTLATFEAKGQVIIDALENGVSQVEAAKGRFPQVAGLKFSWSSSAAPNEGRVQEVLVMKGGEWTPIDPAATYGVVTNNYLRGGGDGYKMFRDNTENAYDYGPGIENVVADYIAALGGSYTPYTDGRINQR